MDSMSETTCVDRTTISLAAEFGQEVAEWYPLLRVEAAVGSSTMRSFGLVDQCLGDTEALFHAAGESADVRLATP